ncbi:MAG TPA: prepilin-type N-terminal cleavage/methylation domain-containing protein [Thermoanaerobaculia bacterium]|jgi:prepilin-type N-terminal cleavage/methylation domain-containing protein|nr:prepilin-type N-terminal cleavage/methylation domain-containing protein [Thermoanaerobaculia bacterium]
MNRKTHQHGLTLIEVLVALAMLGILMFASLSLTESSRHMTRMNSDRQFGTQKAISILEELKAVATANVNAAGQTLAVLDSFDNGTNTVPELSIQTGVTPGDRVSGNVAVPDGTGWRYSRRVSVSRLGGPTTGGVRLVRVTVFINEPTGERPLAEVSSVIRTLASTSPPTQVYDVYAIAVENVPGWWVYTANLVPFVQNAVAELQSRNPGLEFRVHWITKLSYGRDIEYRPLVNSNVPSTNDINQVYFYPGTLPQNDAVLNPPNLSEYYPSRQFQARMWRDNNPVNGYDADNNPVPYALADQYNSSMRYYAERALYDARRAAVDTDGELVYPNEEPTYRLLLDDMVLNPAQYTNAILINLHGELFPFPPVRNYSDPAKVPDGGLALANVRAVTHPERLTYSRQGAAAADNVRLRVYAYETVRDVKNLVVDDNAYIAQPITIVIPRQDLTGMIQITAIEGGTSQTQAVFGNELYRSTTPALAAPNGNRMYATIENRFVSGVNNTVIQLFNTPYRTPECMNAAPVNCGNTTMGLDAAARLYDMDYIPSPVETITTQADLATAFTRDLDDNSAGAANVPKNTARWIININSAALDVYLNGTGQSLNQAFEVRTSIGAPPVGALPTTGRLEPVRDQPANLSRTWVWRGSNVWLWGDGTETNPPNVPPTERFQFLGDPRHHPYADAKLPWNAAVYGLAAGNYPAAMGFNRYFDDFQANPGPVNAIASWPGWMNVAGVKNDGNVTNDGWTPGTSCCGPFGEFEIDMPRAFQLIRNGLTASRAIYTTMTGYSYYYVGIGGEIGYDSANQFARSIPLSTRLYSGVGGTTTEQSITNDLVDWGNPDTCDLPQGCGVKYVRDARAGTDYWWSMFWLGELYPDNQYAVNWTNNGNLPTGVGSNNFRRVLRGLVGPTAGTAANRLPVGTDFNGGLAAGGDFNAVRRTLSQGSTSLFWTGNADSATFHHMSNNSNGVLTADGLTMAHATFGYKFPLLDPIPNNRPFNINVNSLLDNPENFRSGMYGPVFPTNIEAEFYRQTGVNQPGSALVSMRNGTTNRVSFIVVNGLSPTGDSGSNFIARWSFLSLIHSYMDAGLYTDAVGCTGCPFRVTQLPRVAITVPNETTELVDPDTVRVEWARTWRRWDGEEYTPAYADNFGEGENVSYQVMYSRDNGVTWQWMADDAPVAELEVRNPTYLIPDLYWDWDTPAADFPDGNYLIRVEAYRDNFTLHYSYHQFMTYIRRTS